MAEGENCAYGPTLPFSMLFFSTHHLWNSLANLISIHIHMYNVHCRYWHIIPKLYVILKLVFTYSGMTPVWLLLFFKVVFNSYYNQSYEIKSPPWTKGIFSVKNIARLGVFMFQTSNNIQLCIGSQSLLFSVIDYCLKFEVSKHSTYLYFQQGKGPPSRQA